MLNHIKLIRHDLQTEILNDTHTHITYTLLRHTISISLDYFRCVKESVGRQSSKTAIIDFLACKSEYTL